MCCTALALCEYCTSIHAVPAFPEHRPAVARASSWGGCAVNGPEFPRHVSGRFPAKPDRRSHASGRRRLTNPSGQNSSRDRATQILAGDNSSTTHGQRQGKADLPHMGGMGLPLNPLGYSYTTAVGTRPCGRPPKNARREHGRITTIQQRPRLHTSVGRDRTCVLCVPGASTL